VSETLLAINVAISVALVIGLAIVWTSLRGRLAALDGGAERVERTIRAESATIRQDACTAMGEVREQGTHPVKAALRGDGGFWRLWP
jgi:hypothetical protein